MACPLVLTPWNWQVQSLSRECFYSVDHLDQASSMTRQRTAKE